LCSAFNQGEVQGKLEGPDVHTGTVYQVAFNATGSQFATCSADKTVKVWDTASKACVNTYRFGGEKPQSEDMQVALDWGGDNLVSMSLGGKINVINTSNNTTRVITGHQETCESMDVHKDSGRVVTGAFSGKLFYLTDGAAADFPVSHSKRVSGVATAGDTTFTVGWDDQLRIVEMNSIFDTPSISVTLPGQPVGVSACASLDKANTTCLVSTLKGAVVVKNGKIAYTGAPTVWDPACCAMSPDGHLAAIGGKDNNVHLYNVDHASGALTEAGVLESRAAITCLAFSNDSTKLCTGDADRKVLVWDCSTKSFWCGAGHTASVTSCAWSPCGQFVVSGSLDSNIIFWSPEEKRLKETIKYAHVGGVKVVKYLNKSEIVTCGADGCIKYWEVPV
jgi:WD40 repeat protein